MRTNCELRAVARQSLSKKWGIAAIVSLVYCIIYGIAKSIPWIGLLLTVLLMPLGYGFCVLFLRNFRGEEISIEKIFDGFQGYGRILGTCLLATVYTLLWTLLLVIPGFIKSYSYALTAYILYDEPELSFNAAIEKSMTMMEGHKMRLFLLDLSFIGWFFLSLLTIGIGFLWLGPYCLTARAAFYEDLKKEEAATAV